MSELCDFCMGYDACIFPFLRNLVNNLVFGKGNIVLCMWESAADSITLSFVLLV